MHGLGIHFIGALRQDQVHHLLHHLDVGHFQIALVERAETILAGAAQFRRALPEGAWITASDVAQPLVVKRGQPLEVRTAGPGMQLHLQSEALQDGELGQIIRARGPRPGATVKVRIVSAGLAELVL